MINGGGLEPQALRLTRVDAELLHRAAHRLVARVAEGFLPAVVDFEEMPVRLAADRNRIRAGTEGRREKIFHVPQPRLRALAFLHRGRESQKHYSGKRQENLDRESVLGGRADRERPLSMTGAPDG